MRVMELLSQVLLLVEALDSELDAGPSDAILLTNHEKFYFQEERPCHIDPVM